MEPTPQPPHGAGAEHSGDASGPVQFNLAQRVAFATGLQIAGKLAVLAAALASMRLATNYLGVDAFGDFAIVLTGATLVLAAGDLGVTTLLAREISKDPPRADEIAGNLLFLRLASAAAILLLALLTIPLLPFPGRVREGLILAIAGSLIGIVALFPTAFFQVHLRFELAVVLDIVVRGLALALMVTVVALDKGFMAMVATTPIAWGVGVVVAFWLSRRFWHPSIRFDSVELRRFCRIAAPVSLVVTLGLVHFKVDAVMMSFLQPAVDVGIYTIAYTAIEQSLILPGLFMAAVFPILTRLVHGRDAASYELVEKSFRFLAVLGLLVAVLIFTLAVPFVRLVSNADYSAAVTPMRILAFAIVPLFAGAVFVGLLIAMGELRELVVVSGLAIVLNVLLNAFLIPKYSYNGAAAATVSSEAVVAVAVAFFAERTSGIVVARGDLVRLTCVALLVGGALAATFTLSWWWAAPIAVAVCLVSAVGVGAVTRADLEMMLARRAAPADG